MPVADDLCTTTATQRCLAVLRELSGDAQDGPMERHSIRVVLLAEELARRAGYAVDAELLLCAGLLHDLGLYPGAATKAAYVTDGRVLAEKELAALGWAEDRVRLCADAVEHHHEIVSQAGRGNEVELMRRADLIEVSHGLIMFGVPRPYYQDLLRRVPRRGFVPEVLRGLGGALRDRPASLWRIARPGG